jgi:hypothetical protein
MDMRNNFTATLLSRKTFCIVASLIVLAVLVPMVSVLRHYDRLRFFERTTGVSLAPLEKIRVFGNDRFTGSGWVEVAGQIPHSEINSFIADNGFIQFDMRYAGAYSTNWSDGEYELWVLQDRIFGIPPLRYRRFSAVPRVSKEALPPDSDDYFLWRKGKEGHEWHIVLEKSTGTFWGRILY